MPRASRSLLINLVLLRIAGNTAVAAYGVIANLALVETAIFTGLSTGVQPLIKAEAPKPTAAVCCAGPSPPRSPSRR
ncbi:MAG: hypothetical protein ACLR4Z_10555 [Butyricicoccaceae bacterium]